VEQQQKQQQAAAAAAAAVPAASNAALLRSLLDEAWDMPSDPTHLRMRLFLLRCEHREPARLNVWVPLLNQLISSLHHCCHLLLAGKAWKRKVPIFTEL
jgi:hypothetical protein